MCVCVCVCGGGDIQNFMVYFKPHNPRNDTLLEVVL